MTYTKDRFVSLVCKDERLHFIISPQMSISSSYEYTVPLKTLLLSILFDAILTVLKTALVSTALEINLETAQS